MYPIFDRSDFDRALVLPHWTLFLGVNWSIQARQSRSVVVSCLAAWQTENPDCPFTGCEADLSSQSGALWTTIGVWLETQAFSAPASRLMMSGSGPLLWVRAGQVVAHILTPHLSEPAMILAITRRVFFENGFNAK